MNDLGDGDLGGVTEVGAGGQELLHVLSYGFFVLHAHEGVQVVVHHGRVEHVALGKDLDCFRLIINRDLITLNLGQLCHNSIIPQEDGPRLRKVEEELHICLVHLLHKSHLSVVFIQLHDKVLRVIVNILSTQQLHAL